METRKLVSVQTFHSGLDFSSTFTILLISKAMVWSRIFSSQLEGINFLISLINWRVKGVSTCKFVSQIGGHLAQSKDILVFFFSFLYFVQKCPVHTGSCGNNCFQFFYSGRRAWVNNTWWYKGEGTRIFCEGNAYFEACRVRFWVIGLCITSFSHNDLLANSCVCFFNF